MTTDYRKPSDGITEKMVLVLFCDAFGDSFRSVYLCAEGESTDALQIPRDTRRGHIMVSVNAIIS